MAKQIFKPVREVILNPMQMAAVQSNRFGVKKINIEAGRGAGKSTVLGWFVKEAVRQMPRATGVLVGSTFVQIKSRTFPSTKEGLEFFGLYEGFDYVVGKSGKSLGFEMPFQAPNSWNNVVHFANGYILILVSLEDSNSGRGLNSYNVIGDEAALLEQERLFNNVLTTNRAKKAVFDKATMLHSQIFTSSVALTKIGEWFTQMEQLARKNPKEYSFIKANAYVNVNNLKKGWIKEMYDQRVSDLLFNAEILNIRPGKVADGFYPTLSANKHYYKYKYNISLLEDFTQEYKPSCTHDGDLVKGLPLHLSLDFGGRINCGIVAQELKSLNTLNILKDFHVKNPKILSDLIKTIIEYYEPHKASNDTIYLYHDRSGFKSEANSKTTLAADVEEIFRQAGWKVINLTPNTNNPSHILKFRLISEILEQNRRELPYIQINQDNCPNLIISMENAGLKQKEDAFEKDKSSERSDTIPQEHATHLSDCFDYLLWWKYRHLLDDSYNDSFIITNV
ncbi:MAG: hypothetical protein Q4A09_05015 [Capnocytophaga felis]|nr:hypothetical protein [Capnocytophaga felis]